MEFYTLKERALAIRRAYDIAATRTGSHVWTREDVVRGLVGDVGDLVKLTMAADGVRDIPGHMEKMQHELADCMWALLITAEMYGVDLEQSFVHSMDELEERIQKQQSS